MNNLRLRRYPANVFGCRQTLHQVMAQLLNFDSVAPTNPYPEVRAALFAEPTSERQQLNATVSTKSEEINNQRYRMIQLEGFPKLG
ncbi:hypothetical protein SAMN06272721_11625 [Arthrobacter sp. P2b]|nr:hypothetical protein SAMN06272721_11625 [Arthrobacter sp. P2b]